MPFCPACQTQYDPQTAVCEVCGIDLVDSLPRPETTGDAGGLRLVELARFSNVPEAEMIKELLEINEIRTVLRGEIDPIGAASGAAPTSLLVEAKDLAKGRELYQAYFAGEGGSPAD